MADSPGTVCARHGTETRLSCVECEQPICPSCAIRTPVGFKCPDHATAPRRARKSSAWPPFMVLVLLAVAIWWVRDRPAQQTAAGPTCPTRAAPDVGIGPDGGGTTWTELERSPLCGRFSAVSVWTGQELVIWGGQNCAGAECPSPRAPRMADGAAFGPSRNTWRTVAAAPIDGRDGAAAAWTGTEVVVWGGSNQLGLLADGAAYDPARDEWRTVAPAPISARGEAAAVWTGRELVIWGGSGEPHSDGAAYDPATDSWRPLAPAPIEGRAAPASVWTGREVLVWGGSAGGEDRADGAAYDPARDSWRALAPSPLPPRNGAAWVWSGRELIVWGGASGTELLADGAAHDPATDRWRELPAAPVVPRASALAVWSGQEMLVWGGLGLAADSGGDSGVVVGPVGGRRLAPDLIVPRGDGAAYDPASGSWRRLEQVALLGRAYPVGAWDGEAMVVWGGVVLVDSPASAADGARYTPRPG